MNYYKKKNFTLIEEYYSGKKNIDLNQDNQISIGLDGFIVKYSNH